MEQGFKQKDSPFRLDKSKNSSLWVWSDIETVGALSLKLLKVRLDGVLTNLT